MVVFTSDNGYFFAEHNLGDKRAAYEESIRVPFLVRYPPLGRTNVIVDELALNVDLAPTILDFAGVPAPAGMQGRSLRPLLEGAPAPDWRTSFLYEYYREGSATNAIYQTPTILGVRTRTDKLVLYPGRPEWTECFDLVADPYETNNLAFQAAASNRVAGLWAKLDAHMWEQGFTPRFTSNFFQGTDFVLEQTGGWGSVFRIQSSINLADWTDLDRWTNRYLPSATGARRVTNSSPAQPATLYRALLDGTH
jgi:hypothetical protein